jgi:CubicO group peptidase (beta-lactamase class C family)
MRHARLHVVLWTTLAATPAVAQEARPSTAVREPRSAAVDSVIQHVRARYGLPALAAIVVRSDSVLALATTGVRRLGTPDPVRLTDRFHIGSNGKAITATVIARLVEEGRLTWSTRPVDVLPELASSIHPAYRDVTLQQLLGHQAGAPPYTTAAPVQAAERRMNAADAPRDQRRAFAARLLRRPPHGASGTFEYSNAGYTLAAAMAEAAADEPWESLLQSRLAGPLGIQLRHGQPARTDPAQPWGHRQKRILGLFPAGQYAPDPRETWNLGPLLGPAGDLALSARDYATFLQQHLAGLQGRDGVLRAATIRHLHFGPQGYAFGWGRSTFDGLDASTHAGSEGTFYAVVILLPEQDLAAAILVNSGVPAASQAAVETAKALLRMYTPAAP